VQLAQGDRLTLVNDEGGQPVELVGDRRRPHRRGDPGAGPELAGRGAEGDAGQGGEGEAWVGCARADRARDRPGQGRGDAVVRRTPPPAARADLTALDDGWLVIAAPGLPMAPEAQDTATPVTLLVQRAKPRLVGSMTCPTRWPTRSWTCGSNRRPRKAYFVKAGDYIQIIDVDGRQCTDFQCFSPASWTRASSTRWT
jgi:aminomethyltransferase